MDKNSTFVDISSDEDLGFDTALVDGNFDWINELIENMEGNANTDDANCAKGLAADDAADDDDEVVVIREVVAPTKRRRFSSKVDDFGSGNYDDDCVVLDGDPDKPKSVGQIDPQGQNQDQGSDDDPDDLVIVGEKGQVACRDYPHSRHSCVKFPFSSSIHTDHCNMCYCFVCESPAPCDDWGTGLLPEDHCHAFDKDEFWKNERKKIKAEKAAPPDPVSLTTTNACIADKPRESVDQVQAVSHTMAQNSSLVQTPCINPPRRLPNIISQPRSQRQMPVSSRNHSYCPQLVSRAVQYSRNSSRIGRGANIDLRSISSSPLLKRHQPTGTPLVAGDKSVQFPFNNVHRDYAKSSMTIQASANQFNTNFTKLSVVSPRGALGSATSVAPGSYSVPLQVVAPQYQFGVQPTTPTVELPHYSVANTTPPTLISQEQVAVNSQLQGAVNGQETLPTTTQNNPLSSTVGSLNLQFDPFFENQVVGSMDDHQNGYPTFQIGNPSSVIAPSETGPLFYDIEKSWSELSHL